MPDLDAALDRIRAYLERSLPSFLDAPGAVIGLTDRDRLLGVLPVGKADAFTGAPVKEDTRFEIGSISKSFAALIALQEVERGTLDISAPVTEYVPWFRVRSEFGSAYGPIATHHLLTHTSGLIMGMDFADDAIPAVESLARTSTGFPPGERFFYSNDGYKLVGLILEHVTGSTIRKLLRERVFAPVGMRRTDPAITFESRKDVATGHQRISEDRPPHRKMPLVQAPPIVSTTADGSIISTAADMAAYARMLLNRGRTDDGTTLLSEAAFERFTTPVIETETPGTSYAYGLGVLKVDGHAWLRHSGGMVGYYALLECDVDTGVAAIMMVNGLAEREQVVRYALSVLRAWKEGHDLPDVPPAPDPHAVANAEELAGRYRSRGREITLRADGGRLLLLHADGDEVALEPDLDIPDALAVPHPSLDRFALTPERADGKIVELLHGPDRYVRKGVEETTDREAEDAWKQLTGLYRAYNPWFPAFRVYIRGGALFLSAGEGEYRMEAVGGREFRVGESWSPDRVSFGTVLDGRAHVATYNAHPFWRSFEE